MKLNTLLFGFLIAGGLCVSGCSSVPPEALSQANENSLISDAFTLLMEQGKTTREQEQNFIKSNRRAWHAQNFALNEVPLPPDMEGTPNGVTLKSMLETNADTLQRARELEELLKRTSAPVNENAEQPVENSGE